MLHPVQGANGATSAQAPSDKSAVVPPQQLLTFPQFTPHESTTRTLFTQRAEEGGNTGLLSAQEKIEELTALLAARQGEVQRLAGELEGVRADKVRREGAWREVG